LYNESEEVNDMSRHFTLEYWIDDGWYVGRLKEVPGVFSQGETLPDLEQNIRDAYTMMIEDEALPYPNIQRKEIEVAL
jgi:predicted RNase H-like HicB family nuclease